MVSSTFTLELVTVDTPQYVDFVPALTAAYHALTTDPAPAGLVVDVSACRFLTPGHIVVLACLVEAYHQKGIGVELAVSDNEVHEYLIQIRFFDYWKPDFNRRRFTRQESNTTLCLWPIVYTQVYNQLTDRTFFGLKT